MSNKNIENIRINVVARRPDKKSPAQNSDKNSRQKKNLKSRKKLKRFLKKNPKKIKVKEKKL